MQSPWQRGDSPASTAICSVGWPSQLRLLQHAACTSLPHSMSPVDPSEVVPAGHAARPVTVGPWRCPENLLLSMKQHHRHRCRMLAGCSSAAMVALSCTCNTRSCAINHLLRSFPHSRARLPRISEQVPRSALCTYGEVAVGGVTLAAWSCLFMLTDSEV